MVHSLIPSFIDHYICKKHCLIRNQTVFLLSFHGSQNALHIGALEVEFIQMMLAVLHIGILSQLCQQCCKELLPAEIVLALNMFGRIVQHFVGRPVYQNTGFQQQLFKGLRQIQRDLAGFQIVKSIDPVHFGSESGTIGNHQNPFVGVLRQL